MALEINDLFITSDVTPEFARYIPASGGGSWSLPWLPNTPLSRAQAISAMVLDETLSDPALIDCAEALELAAHRAKELGTDLADVIVRLHTRIVERDQGHPDHVPAATA